MFRVVITYGDNNGIKKRTDVVMKTEKLFELIGRFTIKYNPPMEVEITHGISEFEFYKEKGSTFESATISFAKILPEGRRKRAGVSTGRFTQHVPMGIGRGYTPSSPPTPVGPTESDDPRLSELFTKGLVESSTYHR